MKELTSGLDSEVIHKEVVIIGNGPSGISLSAMLSGVVPHLVSCEHPDEMLSARLHMAVPSKSSQQHSLAQQQSLLEELASGLEGRTTNPVSLLLDALEHPCADLGVEMPALVQWRRDPERQIDHVVLGKGPPGGSWHTMDPNVLTLSLGSWMALPGLPYTSDDITDSQRRASAGSVARYYEHYVKEMNLERYFKSGVHVINIEEKNSGTAKKESEIVESGRRKCSFVNALNFIKSRTKCYNSKKSKEQHVCFLTGRTCKRPRDSISKHDLSPNRKVRELVDRSYFSMDVARISRDSLTSDNSNIICTVTTSKSKHFADSQSSQRNKIRSLSFSCDSDFESTKLCDRTVKTNLVVANQTHNSLINISDCRLCQCFQKKVDDSVEMEVLCECSDDPTDQPQTNQSSEARWLITAFDTTTKKKTTYSCCHLVLANGASDLPNRLGLPAETYDLPWVLHDLRRLEDKLDEFAKTIVGNPDPVLVIGAGLSAADAVIATRFRNIPVLHVFRNKSVSLDKQLPENMYPEYHKVHQMMLDGGSTYPLYTALPEHSIRDINSCDKTVTISSRSGALAHHKVSFVVVLIGSRPNLSFLPAGTSLGVNKAMPVDAKANPIDIDKLTHSVNGYEGLYAVGPLAGDNFVRFIPGGALAVVSDLYKKRNW